MEKYLFAPKPKGNNLGTYYYDLNLPNLDNVIAEDGDYYEVSGHPNKRKPYTPTFKKIFKATQTNNGQVTAGYWRMVGTPLKFNLVGDNKTPPVITQPTGGLFITVTDGMNGSSTATFTIGSNNAFNVTNLLFKMNGTTIYNGLPFNGNQTSVSVNDVPTGNVFFELTVTDVSGNKTITKTINNQ